MEYQLEKFAEYKNQDGTYSIPETKLREIMNLIESEFKSKSKKQRKRCETPYTELVMASILTNFEQASFPLDYSKITISSEQLENYNCDMKIRTLDELNNWFMNSKKNCIEFYKQLGISLDKDIVTCYLTGKKIEDPKILELVQGIEKKQKKADIYILVNNIEWIGISVKTTPGDTMSNWSIEKLIFEVDKETVNILKETKIKLLNENGITRNWRDNKNQNREKYNKLMYGSNKYKSIITKWMTDFKNKEYIKKIIAEIAGSPITKFKMFKYDGKTFTNLFEIYQKISNAKTFNIIPDLPSSKLELDKLGLKSHYSDKASKIWFYVEIDSQVDYRIEIRWKGDPFASPQLQLYQK